MEIFMLALVIVLFMPALYLVLATIWLINAIYMLATHGPRKGVQEIKYWNARL